MAIYPSIHVSMYSILFLITFLQNKFEEMKECYECSQENLKCKKEELADANNIIESMQEKIILIENELAAYKNENIDHSKYNCLQSYS